MVKKNYSAILGSVLLLIVLFIAGLEIANKVSLNMTGDIVLNPPIPALCSDASIIRTWESMFNEPAVRVITNNPRTVYTNLDTNCSVSAPCLPKAANLICMVPQYKNQTCQKLTSFGIGSPTVPVYFETSPKRYCNSTADCSGINGASCREAINPQKTCHRTSIQTGSYNQTLIAIIRDTDPNRCRVYFAYKIKSVAPTSSSSPGTTSSQFSEVLFLRGKNDPYFNPQKEVIGIRGNFSQEFLTRLSSMTSEQLYLYAFNSTNQDLTFSQVDNRIFGRSAIPGYLSPILSGIGAEQAFRQTFKPTVDFGEWRMNSICYGKLVHTILGKIVCREVGSNFINEDSQVIFTIDDLDSTGKKSIKAEVAQNKSFEMLTYGEYETPVCTPDWVAHNSSCGTNDYLTVTYTDSNNCGQTKDAESINCDYGNKKIIGLVSEIATENLGSLTLKIGGVNFNSVTDYSSSGISEVKILESSHELISFEWDFSYSLNLRGITIQKQDNNDDEGYLIVNGLEEVEKTFTVSKLTSENQVCVEDRDVNGRGDISPDCDEDYEYLVECPGTNSQFECSIEGNYYIVSGLSNSGVEETSGTGDGTGGGDCTPSWSCESWGTCSGGIQTRTCTDSESCGTTQGRPALSQSCSPLCVSDWDCGDWSNVQESCGKRSCFDTVGCATPTNKPVEEMSCPSIITSKPTWLIWLIIIVLILLSIGVIATIIVLVAKNSKRK